MKDPKPPRLEDIIEQLEAVWSDATHLPESPEQEALCTALRTATERADRLKRPRLYQYQADMLKDAMAAGRLLGDYRYGPKAHRYSPGTLERWVRDLLEDTRDLRDRNARLRGHLQDVRKALGCSQPNEALARYATGLLAAYRGRILHLRGRLRQLAHLQRLLDIFTENKP